MKKNANLSINTIIIAVLALIVLVILIVIFTGKASIFRQNLLPTCQEQGGKCLQKQGSLDDVPVCNDDRPIKMITRGCKPDYGGPSDNKEDRGMCCLPVKT